MPDLTRSRGADLGSGARALLWEKAVAHRSRLNPSVDLLVWHPIHPTAATGHVAAVIFA